VGRGGGKMSYTRGRVAAHDANDRRSTCTTTTTTTVLQNIAISIRFGFSRYTAPSLVHDDDARCDKDDETLTRPPPRPSRDWAFSLPPDVPPDTCPPPPETNSAYIWPRGRFGVYSSPVFCLSCSRAAVLLDEMTDLVLMVRAICTHP